MPWCPKCNAEYINGITKCHDCGVELVDEPVDIENDKNKRDKLTISDEHLEEVLLGIVDDVAEFSYITSMLESEGIPHWVMEQGADQYFRVVSGMKFFAKGIYVSEYDLDKAKEIVDSYTKEENIDDSVWENEGYDEVEDEQPSNAFDWIYRLKPQWVVIIGGVSLLVLFFIIEILFWFI